MVAYIAPPCVVTMQQLNTQFWIAIEKSDVEHTAPPTSFPDNDENKQCKNVVFDDTSLMRSIFVWAEDEKWKGHERNDENWQLRTYEVEYERMKELNKKLTSQLNIDERQCKFKRGESDNTFDICSEDAQCY